MPLQTNYTFIRIIVYIICDLVTNPMKLVHTHNEKEHVRIVLTALGAPIKGRADAVKMARKVLVYLSTRVGSMRNGTDYMSCWYRTEGIMVDLNIPNRTTVDRAIHRLRDQGLIHVGSSWKGKRFVRIMF